AQKVHDIATEIKALSDQLSPNTIQNAIDNLTTNSDNQTELDKIKETSLAKHKLLKDFESTYPKLD
ncbi:hypothetical protein, partial [Mycoplasma nasistruthionis]|uniref:hypothetical protein n=1 Tax=Mycoplasma nasistruthionis TaxID=353852 RepID=UPI001C9E9E51